MSTDIAGVCTTTFRLNIIYLHKNHFMKYNFKKTFYQAIGNHLFRATTTSSKIGNYEQRLQFFVYERLICINNFCHFDWSIRNTFTLQSFKVRRQFGIHSLEPSIKVKSKTLFDNFQNSC